jgi:putative DNA primase/helicase
MNLSTPEVNIIASIPYGAFGKKQNFNLTQLGNAERFAAQYSADIKYCHAWKKWLIWDGKRWTLDHKDLVVTLAAKTVRSIYAEAKSISDDDVKTTHEKYSRRSESAYNLEAILKLARSRPDIPVTPDEYDGNPWLFNCANGTIDLRTGKLRSHAKEDLMTKLASVEYRPDAECPHWMAFLNRVLGEDQTLIEFLQKAIGYSLTGSVNEKALFFLHGTGDNGKTTLVEAVRKIMGEYAGTVDIDALMKKAQTPENERATEDLLWKRFVTSSEAAEGEPLHEARIKHLTGMGRLSGRRIYGSGFEFDPQFKLFIDANHKPRISGTEEAIWNRFKMIPFAVSIPKAEQDKRLLEKLGAEAPGILAWAVQGCLRWRHEGGLGAPEAVTEATESYRNEMDPASDFIADCCIDDPEAVTPFAELYSACREWCHTYDEKVMSQKTLGTALDRHGFAAVRTAHARGRKGLALRHPAIGDTAYDA